MKNQFHFISIFFAVQVLINFISSAVAVVVVATEVDVETETKETRRMPEASSPISSPLEATTITTPLRALKDRFFIQDNNCDVFDDAWECKAYPGCYWDEFDRACYSSNYDTDKEDDISLFITNRKDDDCHNLYRSRECDRTPGCFWDYDDDKCLYEDECYNHSRPGECERYDECVWYRDEDKCLPEEVAHDHKCRKRIGPRQCKRTFGCKWDNGRGCEYDHRNGVVDDDCKDIYDPWECKSSPHCLLVEYNSKREKDCVSKGDIGKIDCWDIYSKSSCESIYGCEWNYKKEKCFTCV